MKPELPPGWYWAGDDSATHGRGYVVGTTSETIAAQAWNVWHQETGIPPERWKEMTTAEARVKKLKERCEGLEGELVWHQTYVRPLNDPDNPRHISEVLESLEYAESRLKVAKDERDAAEEEADRAETFAEKLAEALEMALEEYVHRDSEGGHHCIHCGAAWKDPAQEHHAMKCHFMRRMLAEYKKAMKPCTTAQAANR